MEALIVSLSPNIGHLSHVLAYYELLSRIGYNCSLLLNERVTDYVPKNLKQVKSPDAANPYDIVILYSPSPKNLLVSLKAHKNKNTKLLYVFHEPIQSFSELRAAGFSFTYLVRLWIINIISRLLVKCSDIILLPSKKALDIYKHNRTYHNDNYHYFPLIFDDERELESSVRERSYFSYIGTVAADHSFNEYLDFVAWAIEENRLPDFHFLIATKSDFDVPPILKESPRVVIKKGRPLTNKEINDCYASSFVVWNAYTRTTQSGVLAKCFMFGTPAIVLKRNLSEFTNDRQEVYAIDDNTSYYEIENSVLEILKNYSHYSNAARNRFEQVYHYVNYTECLKHILSQ